MGLNGQLLAIRILGTLCEKKHDAAVVLECIIHVYIC